MCVCLNWEAEVKLRTICHHGSMKSNRQQGDTFAGHVATGGYQQRGLEQITHSPDLVYGL